MILPLFLAFLVSVTEYFSRSFDVRHKSYFQKLLSFSAGVSITYILLDLFPLFTRLVFEINQLLFLSLLIGFILHHIVEKEIYLHNRRHQLIKQLNKAEHYFYYGYHLILGILLVHFAQSQFFQGVFFAISILAFTLVSNLPSDAHKSPTKVFLLSTSTLVGAFLGTLIDYVLPEWLFVVLIGLVTGMLLFTVTRHHIPYGRKGELPYFTLGFLLYAAIIVLSWYL